MQIEFLGTGASGGTPGRGRSARRESSALIRNGSVLMLDVTRDFSVQAKGLKLIDAVLLTHGHRDAIGGMPQLRRWWIERGGRRPIDIFLSRQTAEVLSGRYTRLEHCRLRIIAPSETMRAGSFEVVALQVPHAREHRFTTYAWRVSHGGHSLVYASDVASLTGELERFAAGADALILDGAMWRRRMFSHLTIDEALPTVCRWAVDVIILTQIGRSAPAHPRLKREIAALCPRALPAYDGLAVAIPASAHNGSGPDRGSPTTSSRKPRRRHP